MALGKELRLVPGDSGMFGLLLRLRLLYVYCARLRRFGLTPGPEQLNILRGFRDG
jgi:hypothetical protein